MQQTYVIFIFVVSFILINDWLIYHILINERHKKRSLGILHLITSAASIILTTYYFTQNTAITEWRDYILFQNIMLFFTILYGAKTIYTAWHFLSAGTVKLVKKLPVSRHWTDRMNAGKYPVMTRRKFTSQIGIVLARHPLFR